MQNPTTFFEAGRDLLGETLDRISIEVGPEEFARGDFTKLQSIIAEALEIASQPRTGDHPASTKPE